MASSSPLQQVRLVLDHFDASVSILDAHEVLIPVELPERPAEAISDPLRLLEFPTSSIETVEADFASLTRRRETSPGSPLGSRHPEEIRDLSGSPQSDVSRHSEDSVVIVGDIFAAPTGLKFSLEGIPNVKNAGAFDRYGRPTGQQSAFGSPFPPSISFTRRRTEPIIPVTPKSISPKTRQRPLPTPPNVPQIRSPFMPAPPTNPATPTLLSPSSSMIRPKTSPGGPRPRGNSMSSEGTTKSAKRRRRRRGSIFSPSDDYVEPVADGQYLHSSVEAPFPVLPSSGQFDLLGYGLNPLAASFEPGGQLKPRALSLPDGTITNVDDRIASITRRHVYDSSNYHHDPIQPHPVIPFPKMNTGPYQNVAHIQQDLPHLRQWSSLFRNEPLTLAEQRDHLIRLQMIQYEQQRQQQQQQQQQFAAYTLGQPRDGFGIVQGLPFPFPIVQNQQGHFHQGFFAQDPSGMQFDSRRSSYTRNSISSGSSYEPIPLVTPSLAPVRDCMLDLTPVQLPEARLTHPSHTMLSPLDAGPQNYTPEKVTPIQRGALPVVSTPRASSVTPVPVGSTSKALGAKLAERGTSSLTPVTERSEISSANASAHLTPERTPMPGDKQKEELAKKRSKSRRTRKKIAAKLAAQKGK